MEKLEEISPEEALQRLEEFQVIAALGLGSVVGLAGSMIAWNRERLPVEQTDLASRHDLLDAVIAWVQVAARERHAARDELRKGLRSRGPSHDEPTHLGVEQTLELVEGSLRAAEKGRSHGER